MENIVLCKRCGNDFNYSPGISGNARQLCDICRMIVDNEELEALKDQTIIEGNKYLIGAPKRKDVYDMVEILINGSFPEFDSDIERFVCANEVGEFLHTNGFSCNEKMIVLFLHYLGPTHAAICLNRLDQEQAEHLHKYALTSRELK
jgi:hypothetical protein